MEHFTINWDGRAAETTPDKPSLFQQAAMEGHCIPLPMQGFWVWAEDNEPEIVTVHVAAARRYGSIDAVADDQPFSIFSGVLA